jgi:flavin reductase (DIM6/NTAB) family NADH-FMN oxidoreductase RutF
VPGSTIRYGDPWADPPSERDPVRRARARLPAPVTVWTAGDADSDWTGLTVSSVLLAQGQPGRLIGLIGPDSDLAEAITAGGMFVVHLLADRPEHRRLAQHFAGALPADPTLLAVEASRHGPRLTAVADQLACRASNCRPAGWSQLVEAEVAETRLGPPVRPLLWYRGEFWRGA